jgi:hypothetical protein
MEKYISIILLSLMLATPSRSNPSDTISHKSDKNGSTLLTIGIVGSALAVGAVTCLLINSHRKTKHYRDSIATIVESDYKQAKNYYNNVQFTDAKRLLITIRNRWSEYKRCRKGGDDKRIKREDVQGLIEDCTFLEPLAPSITEASNAADILPSDKDALIVYPRYMAFQVMQKYRMKVHDLIQQYPKREEVIRHSYSGIFKKFDRIESLYDSIYEQAKNNFKLKCRFFYNRAKESSNPNSIEYFVDDCEYYKVNKPWCKKARAFVHSRSVSVSHNSKSTERRFDSEFHKAVTSKRPFLLEQYIRKNAMYRSGWRRMHVDSAKKVLSALRSSEKDSSGHSTAMQNRHRPLKVAILGLSSSDSALYRECISNLDQELRKIKGIHHPIGITIDYRKNPPLLLLSGNVLCNRDTDIITSMENGGRFSMQFHGTIPAATYLHHLKEMAATRIGTTLKTRGQSRQAALQHTQSIRKAVYAIRFWKNTEENITLYAQASDTSKTSVTFYGFFDITTSKYKNIRIPNQPSPLINPSKDPEKHDRYARILYPFFDL